MCYVALVKMLDSAKTVRLRNMELEKDRKRVSKREREWERKIRGERDRQGGREKERGR